MKFFNIIALLFSMVSSHVSAEKLTIAFESFPPFITEDGNGFTVDMLREIEKISDLRFDVIITTYARAKYELKNNRIDLAGHTPKNLETDEFYHYAEELDWQINTTADLFSLESKYLDINNIKKNSIGTTSGNAVFFAQQMGIEQSYFVEVGSLNQLVDMFIKKRIDTILFERTSVMTLLEQKKFYGVFYKAIGDIPASIAVRNNDAGLLLKAKLDELINKIDTSKLFYPYLKYTNLPSEGKTTVLEETKTNAN